MKASGDVTQVVSPECLPQLRVLMSKGNAIFWKAIAIMKSIKEYYLLNASSVSSSLRPSPVVTVPPIPFSPFIAWREEKKCLYWSIVGARLFQGPKTSIRFGSWAGVWNPRPAKLLYLRLCTVRKHIKDVFHLSHTPQKQKLKNWDWVEKVFSCCTKSEICSNPAAVSTFTRNHRTSELLSVQHLLTNNMQAPSSYN